MEFYKYPSIENSYREKFVDMVMGHPEFPRAGWQVTEKIHGANFSFVVDKQTGEVRVGKRSSLTDGGFYGCQEVLDRYRDRILNLSTDELLDGCDAIQIYGELYGDGIQKGVTYSEIKDFAAFDIRCIQGTDSRFMGTVFVESLCEFYGVPHVPVIDTGCTFEAAMAYSGEFDSLIGYERIRGNAAEGVVIKPMSPMFLHGGSRVILKTKSDKFKERSSAKKVRVSDPFTDEMTAALDSLLEYLNENRLKNVLSKLGEVTQKDFGVILGGLCQDVIEDWSKDNDWGVMDKKHRKAVTKELNKQGALLVRRNFLNIIDGVF
jgi:Rnl2 family RNA ligase